MKRSLMMSVLFAALAVSHQASAIPPVPPMDGGALEAYIAANKRNDLRAYAELFAPNAVIVVQNGAAFTKSTWIKAGAHFDPARRIRYLSGVGNFLYEDDKRGGEIVLTVEEQQCHPKIMECWATYHTETLKFLSGKIVSLKRSEEFTHGFGADGRWRTFME